ESDYACYLIARLWSALFGIALVLLTYIGARQLTRKAGALTAASLAACSLVLVSYSRLPVSDIMLACFMLACVVTLLRKNLGLKAFALAGVFTGLAVGAKFSGLFLLPFGVMVILLRAYQSGDKIPLAGGLTALGLCACATFILTTPWILVSYSDYWGRFAQELHGQSFGQIGRVQLGYFDYLVSHTPTWEQPWLGTSILANEGIAILIAAGIAAVAALSFRFGYAPAVHALFVIIYLALVSQPGHLKAIRFVAPVLPSLFILCGWLAGLLLDQKRSPGRFLAHIAFGLILLAYPLYRTTGYLASTSGTATNVHARSWLSANVPANATLVLSPFFINSLDGVTDTTIYLSGANLLQYRMPGNASANSELSPLFHSGLLDEFRARGVDYYVANSWFEGAYAAVDDNLRWFPISVKSYSSFRQALQRETELVFTIRGFEEGRPGPDIHIYRLTP
ncbi:MAG: phospholipid carrier-dependent glycosyltransferase, partial [Xanthomonadales bacterium]|nr:phospholipid carrier-dependent glycosyltransferase [Xanthomonadales bacterium]